MSKSFSRRDFIQQSGMVLGAITGTALIPAFANHEAGGKKLNIALCGLGRYAGYLAEGLQQAQYCTLAGIVTGTKAKAAAWQKQYNIPDANIYNYENFDEIASNKNIDLVYIVLPNAMHKAFTIRAARAGKHVIVEKPMGLTAAECTQMMQACQQAGVQLAVGYRLHYEPYNLEIKRLGQQKILGQVRLIETSLGYKTSDPAEWRLNKALAGGGPLMNIGIYCVQAARYVLGEEPVAVTAQFGPVTNPELFKEVEESITWQLHFASGAVATSSSSYNCSIDRFFASADNGFFELSPAISYGPFKGRSSLGEFKFDVINQQAVQCDEIAKPILAGTPLPNHITGIEGFKDLKVMDAIYAAATSGNKIILT
ncbi:MAG: hypothetical protein RL172_188 [Bacteroidota bacterium]